ncbi:MAG: NUDIX hydrolase [Cyanobacteria bacterium QH_8_48_120]|jgi:8-oxo-dGTP diphosphatase|nr:MAG: NUDIX hydrolase [Cyanobacteria bacterium QH_1_48_107]PSO56423.1 MAG: NUDIX hydrolase [Cyanobacteria bacterium QH_10_48_56]PSO71854.1 MAG: NUDIX hydrolase [Cyanobacteria bacterium QH_8_48_120]
MDRTWQFLTTVLGIIFRHPVTGATIIPILPDGRIVLIRGRETGQWSLPGGIVNWGEDLPTAARRELAEETGLELLKIRRLVGVYSTPERDPRVHSISVAIEADVEGIMQAQDKIEVWEVQAFVSHALPLGNLRHDHERQLQDYFNGLTTVA